MTVEERVLQILDTYEEMGVSDAESVFNELMRFRAIEKMIDEGGRDFTLTLDQLYAMAEEKTVEEYGDIPFDKKDMGRAYQMAFNADIFEVLDHGISIDGMVSGQDLADALYPVLTKWQEDNLKGRILFAHVEEYASYVGDILARFGAFRPVFQVETEAANQILRRLYPKATFIVDLPKDQSFDHILFIHRGTFDDSTKAMIDSIAILGEDSLTEDGSASYFIDVRAFYDDPEQKEEWKAYFEEHGYAANRWADFFYQNRRLQQITEWLPLELYQLDFTREEVDIVGLKFAEILSEEEVLDEPLIGLHRERMLEMKNFSLVDYALACCGYIAPEDEETVNYGWSLEGEEEAPWRHSWEMDPMNTALWVAFMQSKRGQQISEILQTFANSEEAYAQLMLGLRRPVLKPEVADEIAARYWQGITDYEKEVQAAEEKWLRMQDDIVASFEKEIK